MTSNQRSRNAPSPGFFAGLLLSGLAVACGTGGGEPAADPEPPHPNVVLIIIDTLRADMLSSYGHPADPSPALSRIAADAVQFDSVIAQTSWTLPSIGSMLTSQYPRTLGLYQEGDQVLPERFPTLAEVFQEHGYATFGVTANPNINSRAQFDQGFDQYVDSLVVFEKSREDVAEGEIFFRDSKLNSADDLLEQARAFAAAKAEIDPERPVFLQLNLMEVHEYARENMLRPPYRQLFPDEPQARYLRSVRQVTDDIEQFVREVSALPGWEDALFCITSDHGEGLTDHPGLVASKGHGALLYPSMVHVPWLLFGNAWSPTVAHVTQDVRLLELVPTVLDMAGIEPPRDIQGVSLKPLITGEQETAPLPQYIVTETYFRNFRKVSAYYRDWQYIDNRMDDETMPRFELQSRKGIPIGAKTDVSGKKPDLLKLMRRFIGEWEVAYAEAPPETVSADDELPDEVRRQLEAIGYTR